MDFITLSGSAGCGKTTIVQDFKREFPEKEIIFISSIASHLFSEAEKTIKGLPSSIENDDRSNFLEIIKYSDKKLNKYDDINRLGLREWWQSYMPKALSNIALKTISDNEFKDNSIIITDRWYPDIMAYTAIESQNPLKKNTILQETNNIWNTTEEKLRNKVNRISFYVPWSSVKHQSAIEMEQKKVRATCDSFTYDEELFSIIKKSNHLSLFRTITASDRLDRVHQINTCLSNNDI